MYLDLLVLGATEFLASLFSKVVFRVFSRRTSLLLTNLFMLLCFFFLLIFTAENTQTRYVVTISTRAALQILFNLLKVATLEHFPTETRGTCLSVCMSAGLLSGLALPWIEGLSTNMILMIILIYASASAASIFVRETDKEEGLRNIYEEIYHVEPEFPI